MSLDLNATGNEALLREAVDLGVNYFDTADLYDHGKNELLVGKALKPIRQKVIIATKVGNEWLPDGSAWRWNPSGEYILKSVEESLRRLQTDRIDLYQLHGGTIDDPMEEIMGAFESLQTSGKILHYGISSIRPNVIKPYASQSAIISDMLQYNLLDRRPEEEVLDYLHEQHVGVMVRGALAKGLLAGKPPADYMDYNETDVRKMVGHLAQLTSDNRTMGQVAIRYVLNHPAVTSAIVGMRTRKQLLEAVGTTDAPALTEAEVQALGAVLKPNRYTSHR